MSKTAVVLAGGGSRGAYQIGVWKALRELGEPGDRPGHQGTLRTGQGNDGLPRMRMRVLPVHEGR